MRRKFSRATARPEPGWQDLSNDRRKKIDERLAAITELQKYIGTYSKTRETLRQYNAIKKPKDKQKFYDANAANIILCRAAKSYFDKLGLK